MQMVTMVILLVTVSAVYGGALRLQHGPGISHPRVPRRLQRVVDRVLPVGPLPLVKVPNTGCGHTEDDIDGFQIHWRTRVLMLGKFDTPDKCAKAVVANKDSCSRMFMFTSNSQIPSSAQIPTELLRIVLHNSTRNCHCCRHLSNDGSQMIHKIPTQSIPEEWRSHLYVVHRQPEMTTTTIATPSVALLPLTVLNKKHCPNSGFLGVFETPEACANEVLEHKDCLTGFHYSPKSKVCKCCLPIRDRNTPYYHFNRYENVYLAEKPSALFVWGHGSCQHTTRDLGISSTIEECARTVAIECSGSRFTFSRSSNRCFCCRGVAVTWLPLLWEYNSVYGITWQGEVPPVLVREAERNRRTGTYVKKYNGDHVFAWNAIRADAKRNWLGRRAKFCLEGSANETMKAMINIAMQQITQAVDCITFHEVECSDKEAHRILTNRGDTACKAGLYRRKGLLWDFEVSGCAGTGIIIHEILHGLGRHHEHQRPDRDEHIAVNWDNFREGGGQFERERSWGRFLIFTNLSVYPVWTTDVHKYDHGSISHYEQLHPGSVSLKNNVMTRHKAHGVSALDKAQLHPVLTALEPDSDYKNRQNGWNSYDKISLSIDDAKHIASLYGCSARPKKIIGLGCRDFNPLVCENIDGSVCSESQLKDCCVCGGGTEVHCYDDERYDCPHKESYKEVSEKDNRPGIAEHRERRVRFLNWCCGKGKDSDHCREWGATTCPPPGLKTVI